MCLGGAAGISSSVRSLKRSLTPSRLRRTPLNRSHDLLHPHRRHQCRCLHRPQPRRRSPKLGKSRRTKAFLSRCRGCRLGHHGPQYTSRCRQTSSSPYHFSTKTKGWQRPTQLWLDPTDLAPKDLAAQTTSVHPMTKALILGGHPRPRLVPRPSGHPPCEPDD